MEDALLTSGEVARLLRVHPKHLYRLLRQGLPGHRVGRGHWRFRRAEVLAWYDERGSRSGVETREVEAEGDEPASIEAVLAPGRPLRAGANRVVLGQVRDHWVAHAMGEPGPRCADALVHVEAPVDQAADRTVDRAPERIRARPLLATSTAPDNVLVAGCAPVLGMILDRAERSASGRVHWLPANSTAALRHLADGLVHVAGIHLEDPHTSHDALVRARFPGARTHLVRLLRWRTGLVTRSDGPQRSLTELVDDPSVRWALREPGAGAQRMLGRVLDRLGVPMESLHAALEAHTHQRVAQAVALGAADVGVTLEAVAHEAGLRFVPLAEEGFDLVVPHDLAGERPVAHLLAALDDPGLRRELGALGAYDTSRMGHATSP